MAAINSPPAPTLDGTLGIVQVGMVAATWLFGIESLQTFNYYKYFEKDGKYLRTLVSLSAFLELGSFIACWHAMYSMTITFYGQPEHIASPPLSLVFVVVFNVLIDVIVQSFFAYRVKVLSGRWHIPILCCAVNAVRLAFNLELFVRLLEQPMFALLRTKFKWDIIVASSFPLALDIIIAGSLIHLLWHRRSTQFEQTNRIVDTIIMWTVETTFVTTMSVAMQLILFVARPHDFSWLFFIIIQGKLLRFEFTRLNGRTRLRNSSDLNTPAIDSTHHTTALAIRVQQTTATTYEYAKRDTLLLPA
ncbi:Saposin B-type domain-containing protein [Favolaschia claudopus]|uniref:Saposin B-type domain-containing protein n=1 Tax=Favolaschia claudopus TaxID=2862362 RepID=A0AAW0EC29_9AGAR